MTTAMTRSFSVLDNMNQLASTMMSIIFTIRQHHQRVQRLMCCNSSGVLASLSTLYSLAVEMNAQCQNLILAKHVEQDRISGLSRIACALVSRLSSPHAEHSLSDALVATLLLVPCKYIGVQIFVLDDCDETYCSSISDAMRWVASVSESVSGHGKAMTRGKEITKVAEVLVLSGIALIWQPQRVQPLTWISLLRPRCFVEQVFCLMSRLPALSLPRDLLAVSRRLDAAMFVGSCFSTVASSPGTEDTRWLMGPCLINVLKNFLVVSLHPCVPPAYTDNLLTLLHNSVWTAMSVSTVSSRAREDVFLRDLVRCTSRDGARFEKTAILAVSVVHPWEMFPRRSGLGIQAEVRQACLLCILRLLTGHGLALLLTGPGGWGFPREVMLVELIKRTYFFVFQIMGGEGALPLQKQMVALQGRWGVVAGMEALVREMYRPGEPKSIEAWHIIDETLTILCSFVSTDPACVRTSISVAATLRKLGSAGIRGAMVCMTMLISLQAMGGDSKDIKKLMGVLAMIVTKSLAGRETPGDLGVDLLQPHLGISGVMMGLFGGEIVPCSAAQAPVWERFVVQECPNLLPGCGSMACRNMTGGCEAALCTRLCSGCRRVRYCSDECQREAWLLGGHGEVCGGPESAA